MQASCHLGPILLVCSEAQDLFVQGPYLTLEHLLAFLRYFDLETPIMFSFDFLLFEQIFKTVPGALSLGV